MPPTKRGNSDRPLQLTDGQRPARRYTLAVLFSATFGLYGCTTGSAPTRQDAPFARDQFLADGLLPARDQVTERRPWADLLSGHGPPYPLVLVHGFFGFNGVGPLTYFHGVKDALERGGHQVAVASLDPFNDSYVRGEELLHFVQEVLLSTGAAKVHLVAHSQGGLDARYVANHLPDRIASLVTIATPHRGAHIAEVLMGAASGFSIALAQAFFAAISRPFYGAVAADSDVRRCLEFLRPASLARFNEQVPDQPGVAYYAIGGRSSLARAADLCTPEVAPEFLAPYAQLRDPIDPLLLATAAVLAGSLLSPEPNDGLVRVAESRWGQWLGCIPADHWDQVGQLLGDSPGLGNSFDHLSFYSRLASWLSSHP